MSMVTISELRKIQWDKSNLWEIKIDGFDFKNVDFFPANDTELTFFGIENGQIQSTGLEFVKTRTIPNVTLSYIDDETMSVTKFFTDWQREMVSMDGYDVLPLDECHKTLIITKVNSLNEKLYKWILNVYPTGNLQFHGESDGSLPFYSVNFTVVGGGLDWK